MQLGSITPYYSSTWNLAFYEFRDATGAVYRLDQNNNGIWTSKDSTYVSFNAESDFLYFNDGTHWAMWNTSGGLEPDAGSIYPSYLEDSNGNLLRIYYDGSNGWGSSRIVQIWDARALFQETYDIGYDSNGRLSSITNNIGSGESFTFSFGEPITLDSPFSPSTQFGAVETLSSITNTTNNFQL